MTESPALTPAVESASVEPDPAIVDGVNVDAVSRAVLACAGVSELSGGRFGEVASYLPGRRVAGVTVRPQALEIQVKARWGVTTHDLLSQIDAVTAPLRDGRRVEVVVADIDDPPAIAVDIPALTASQLRM